MSDHRPTSRARTPAGSPRPAWIPLAFGTVAIVLVAVMTIDASRDAVGRLTGVLEPAQLEVLAGVLAEGRSLLELGAG